MTDTFIQQKIETIARCGYDYSAAYEHFFSEMLEQVRKFLPKVRALTKTGPDSIQQIIYLPKAKRELKSKLKRELADYKRAVKNTEAALREMDK